MRTDGRKYSDLNVYLYEQAQAVEHGTRFFTVIFPSIIGTSLRQVSNNTFVILK